MKIYLPQSFGLVKSLFLLNGEEVAISWGNPLPIRELSRIFHKPEGCDELKLPHPVQNLRGQRGLGQGKNEIWPEVQAFCHDSLGKVLGQRTSELVAMQPIGGNFVDLLQGPMVYRIVDHRYLMSQLFKGICRIARDRQRPAVDRRDDEDF